MDQSFPIEYCDYFVASNKLHEKPKDPKVIDKIKHLGCLRYSKQWIKRLDEIYKFEENPKMKKSR